MGNSRIDFLRSTMLTGLLALSALTIQATPSALAADQTAEVVAATTAADIGAGAPSMVAPQTCRSFATCLVGSRTPEGYEVDAGGPAIHLDRHAED